MDKVFLCFICYKEYPEYNIKIKGRKRSVCHNCAIQLEDAMKLLKLYKKRRRFS